MSGAVGLVRGRGQGIVELGIIETYGFEELDRMGEGEFFSKDLRGGEFRIIETPNLLLTTSHEAVGGTLSVIQQDIYQFKRQVKLPGDI